MRRRPSWKSSSAAWAAILGIGLLIPAPALGQEELQIDKIRLGTAPCVLRTGSGSPEGTVVGNVCDTYWRTDGTSFATVVYVKTSGTGTNTGWTTAGSGSGSVTSVGLSLPAQFSVSGSPVTTTGTLTGAWQNATTNYIFAGPATGGAAAPTFRAMVAADVPTLNQNTTGSAAKWTTARSLAGNSVDGSANVAFSNKFIVQGTSDAGLSGAQFLGALGTGLLKNTTTTGVLSIAGAGDLPTHAHAGGDITSGLVGLSVGGTNANLTASTGGIVYSGASAFAILSGTATAGKILRSGSSAAPTWSTATWPNTATTTGAYLRADGTNWITSTLVLPNAATANRLTYATSSNTLGESANLTFDGTTLTVSGNIAPSNVSNHLVPSATDTYDLGSASRLWRNGFLSTMNALVFAETTQTLFGGYSTIGKQVGDFAADVAAAATTINFGETMTPNDWVLVRAHDTGGAIKAEYLRVLTLVSGTTYNVTRDLAAAHATDPAWAAGTPFLVLGAEDTGRIDLIAVDGKPRLVMTQQGSAYNTQKDRALVGNLNTYYGYTSDIWGVAFGDYTANHVTIEPTNGVRFRSGSTVLGQLSSTSWTLGNTASEHVAISSTAVQLKDGSTVLTDISGGNVLVGQAASGQSNVYITSGAVALRNNTTERIKLNSDGSGFLASSNISWTTGGVLSAGGWTVGSADLQAQSGTVGMSSGASYSFWAGDATPASAEFRVTPAGALTATSATITGSVTATTGAIGGWTLGATSLTAGSAGTTVGLDSGGTNPAFYAGSATPASAPFRVTNAGALTATSATITGAITATSGSFTGSVQIGSGGNLRQGQTAYDTGTGFWLGDASGTAKFSLGTSAGRKLTWDGTTLSASGVSFGNTTSLAALEFDSGTVWMAAMDPTHPNDKSVSIGVGTMTANDQINIGYNSTTGRNAIWKSPSTTWDLGSPTATDARWNAIYAVDFNASGDLVVGDDITVNTNKFTVDGATGDVVSAGTISGTALTLSAQPYAKVYKSAAQTAIGATYTLLTWNTEDADTATMHDTSTNTSRILAPSAGTYLVSGYFMLTDAAAGGGGTAYLMARKNAAGSNSGGTYLFENNAYGPNGGVVGRFTPGFVVVLAANDYVEMFAKTTQPSGSLTVEGGAVTDSHFTLVKLF